MYRMAQAGTVALHDALAHPDHAVAYVRLLLYSGVDANSFDKRGRFGRTPADCVVARPFSEAMLHVAALLHVFGAEFHQSVKRLMPPIQMAEWMQHVELVECLGATKKHPLQVAERTTLFADAVAAFQLGRLDTRRCGPLKGNFQLLRLPWSPTRASLFAPPFNALIGVAFFALVRRMPAEMALMVCSFVDPNEGPFVDRCHVPKHTFNAWCAHCV